MFQDKSEDKDKKDQEEMDEEQPQEEPLEEATGELGQVIQGYKNKWMRAVADYQNLKKQSEKEKADWVKYANAALILELLPVVNHFKEAMKHIPQERKDDEWVNGIVQIKKQLDEFLGKIGISEIKTVGENFDPEKHEAVSRKEKSGAKPDEILEEVQPGYLMHDKVIEPAKVVVAK